MSKLSWKSGLKNVARVALETLEDRLTPSVTAVFVPTTGLLRITGDNLNNAITVSRNGAGGIFVNGGAVKVTGGTPTVSNVTQVRVNGLAGHDLITMSETNGALPKAVIFGGAGNDVVTGGSGNDMLFGESGHDQLLGKGGNDQLFGGSGNDALTGGDADDQAFGQDGNDRMIWNPGDDTDLNEGGAGLDTVEANGGGGAEQFTLTANGARVRFDRLDPAPFAIDIGTSEDLVLNMNGGNDRFSATGNLAALIKVKVDGGAGDDNILGSNGIDTLLGGDGNDFIDGQQGNDVAFMGAGDDVFQWDPGDGSDTVEGQAGNDRMLFNGSNGDEIFTASANGGRVTFTRNLGNIVMDLNDVEGIDLNTLGGTDATTVNDLSGTDMLDILVQLNGDALADTVTVNGTNDDDFIEVTANANGLQVNGLSAVVRVAGAEVANDKLIVSGQGGDDLIDVSEVPAGQPVVDVLGGADADTLIGGVGTNNLFGEDGDDVLIRGTGTVTADGGNGTNVVL
jgi:Ca2+-binding RTX toxin-like protein